MSETSMGIVSRVACAVAAAVGCGGAVGLTAEATQPSVVSIEGDPSAGWRLVRNGVAFTIRGAGGPGSLEALAACGGNAIRTWGVEDVEKRVDGERMIDRAHALGIAVTVGLWLGHERHGFDWHDPAALGRQRQMVERAVIAYRDHPAVLSWGLGNEMEGVGDNPVIWREVNQLARRIKELDPHHPVMTVVANVSPAKLAAIKAHAADIDILGINAYAGVAEMAARLRAEHWTKPYCITEFGLPGPWESPVTAWKAPIEPSGAVKAEATAVAQAAIMADAGHCLGSYAFLWGQKQEATSSWFGMFLPTGEKTARVDVMARAWTGSWPTNRAPVLEAADVPFAGGELAGGGLREVRVRYGDPEHDPLSFQWEVREESSDRREGGDAERPPPAVPDAIVRADDRGFAEVRMPSKPGAYRLFVTVTDGHGSGAVDNWPFLVTPSP
jgi:hypothetical protein